MPLTDIPLPSRGNSPPQTLWQTARPQSQYLQLRAVRKHTEKKRLLLYIKRWLEAPVQDKDGTLVSRCKCSPQGSVISPLPPNLFLHYAFDEWMRRNKENIPFERYANDILLHCVSGKQALWLKFVIGKRLFNTRLTIDDSNSSTVKGGSEKL